MHLPLRFESVFKCGKHFPDRTIPLFYSPPLFIEVAWFDELFNKSMDVAFIPVAKPHTHKLYILRHCSNDVYLFQAPHRSHHKILLHMLSWTSLPVRHSHVIITMDLTAVLGGLPLDTVEINFTYVVVSPFVLFSSPYQKSSLGVRRPSYVYCRPSSGVYRPLTFHIRWAMQAQASL